VRIPLKRGISGKDSQVNMADATNTVTLMDGYKEARVAILHQAEVEKGVVNSAGIFWGGRQ